MARYFVGLDVHWKQTSVCILDGHGKRINRQTIRGPWSGIVERLKPLSVSARSTTS